MAVKKLPIKVTENLSGTPTFSIIKGVLPTFDLTGFLGPHLGKGTFERNILIPIMQHNLCWNARVEQLKVHIRLHKIPISLSSDLPDL